jgi:hypothetical protein
MTVQVDARNKQNFGIGQIAPVVDKSTNVRSSIDWIHREVHEGNHWFYSRNTTLADVDDYYVIALITPNTAGVRCELALAVQSTFQVNVAFHEGPVLDAGEVADVLKNNRRETTNTVECLARVGVIGFGGGSGTILAQAVIGNAVFGGSLKWWNNRARLILDPDTVYALKIIGKTAGVVASWQIEFIERTEKA